MKEFTLYFKSREPSSTAAKFDAQTLPNCERTHIPRPTFGNLCIVHTVIWVNVHTENEKYIRNEMSIDLVWHIATANGNFAIGEELQTLTLKRKYDALFHLMIFTHAQSLKLWCAPIACEFHLLWIFTSCNIPHVTIILKELITHNTATK